MGALAAALRGGHRIRHDDAFRPLWAVFDDDSAFHSFIRWPPLNLVEAGGLGEHAAQVAKVTRKLEP